MEDEETILDVAISVLLAITFIVVMFVGVVLVIRIVWSDTPEKYSISQVATNCQYPNGGCDNSDPCDPETSKDPQLAGDCADSRPAQPIEPIEAPITLTPIEGK